MESMNLWQKTATAILRLLIASLLVLSVTSCGEKAVSQEPYDGLHSKAQLSKQISEVSPPTTIQELRSALEVYQPQVTIVTPKQDEILRDDTVSVRFQVKDLPIYQDPELELGPHLHVILDNEPYIAVYNLNNPLVLPDLSPGTHTLRVFASRPWHESFKNEGAYAQTTFHIVTKTDDNNPDSAKPLLTYSRPKGSYGAEPILLDFYLTNAPLHLVAEENPDDEIADWRIRCTINDESFVLDRWQAIYLKGFKPGKNWVKLEFLDEQGNPVKNVFNSTVRLITYEPKGNDTLSKIIRGELSADQVRSIVDPNYTAKIPTAEPTPTPTSTPSVEKTPQTQPKEETQPVSEPIPTPTSTPSVKEIPQQSQSEPQQAPPIQPEKPKSGDFFNRFQRPEAPVETTPGLRPTVPEVIETPQPKTAAESQPEVTPEAESTPVPETVAPQPEEKRGFGRYFNHRADRIPTPQTTAEPTPGLAPTLPEIIESPVPESAAPQAETIAEPKSEVTPEAETTLPQKIAPQPEKPFLK